jgi:hypothetical protein
MMNLEIKLLDGGYNMPCKSPHKDLSLLPQPHLDDRNLRAMLKINKIYRLRTEDNEIHFRIRFCR